MVYISHFLPTMLILATAFLILRQARKISRQLPRLMLGLSLLVGTGLLELTVRYTNSYVWDNLVNQLPAQIYALFLLPVLLSILTHINFYFRPGLWLGILIGVPQVLYYVTNQLSDDFPRIKPLIAILLVVAAFIWLRKNRERIQTILQLKKPNQRPDDQVIGKDPYDHLID